MVTFFSPMKADNTVEQTEWTEDRQTQLSLYVVWKLERQSGWNI